MINLCCSLVTRKNYFNAFLYVLIAFALNPFVVLAQTPVSSYNISNQVSSPKTAQTNVAGYPVLQSTHFNTQSGYDLYYAQRYGATDGNARNITGFTAGGVTFSPYNTQTGEKSFTKVVFKRKEPAVPLGAKYTALYEYSSIRDSNGQLINNPIESTMPDNASVYFDPSFEPTMEGFINGYSLNKGADNVFVNDASVSNTVNNIERIDLIYSSGVIATTSANLTRVGFLLNERGGNDNFSVAAITGIDSDNNVASLGPVKKFTAASWGQAGPSINTVVIQKNGNSSSYEPSQIIGTQAVSGLYISLAALDIPANTKIYGITVLPEDAGTDLLGLTDANTNTSEANGLDLMSGNFAAKDVSLVYATLAGTVFPDANGLNGNPSNAIDGTGMGNPGGVQLSANLLDENSIVVSAVPVNNTNGTYEFTNVSPGTYTIQLSTVGGSVLNPAPDKILPAGWANTGETNNGLGTLSDGTPDGITSVTVETSDIADINFGIEQAPESKNLSTLIPKPVVGDFITLNGGTNPPVLQGIDMEDLATEGELTTRSVKITTVPANTELYYDFGSGSVLLEDGATITAFDPSKLQIKITAESIGESQTSFEYAFVDAAGLADPSPALYVVSWGSPLPVTLSRFEVAKENNTALLQWETTSESNSAYFDVEHSTNGKDWKKIATVTAKGESTQTASYFYNHNALANGVNYYRLKMVDGDETFTYSRIRSLTAEGIASASLFPNPVSDVLFVEEASLDKVKSVELLNIAGVPVYRSAAISREGINVKGLSGGVYLLKITHKDGRQSIQKVVISK